MKSYHFYYVMAWLCLLAGLFIGTLASYYGSDILSLGGVGCLWLGYVVMIDGIDYKRSYLSDFSDTDTVDSMDRDVVPFMNVRRASFLSFLHLCTCFACIGIGIVYPMMEKLAASFVRFISLSSIILAGLWLHEAFKQFRAGDRQREPLKIEGIIHQKQIINLGKEILL